MTVTDPSTTDEWQALVDHAATMSDVHLRQLFADDPDRVPRFTVAAGDMSIDLSKHRVTDETIRLLLALAERTGLSTRTEAMFVGEPINTTEKRAVLHTALRARTNDDFVVDGEDVVATVHDVLDRMADFAERVSFHVVDMNHIPARSSTSESAGPTSAHSWHTGHSRPTFIPTSTSDLSRMSIRPT